MVNECCHDDHQLVLFLKDCYVSCVKRYIILTTECVLYIVPGTAWYICTCNLLFPTMQWSVFQEPDGLREFGISTSVGVCETARQGTYLVAFVDLPQGEVGYYI